MSSPRRLLRVAVAAEGSTDVLVVQAAVMAVLSDVCPEADLLVTKVQPDESRAFLGQGWRGLKRYCEHLASNGGPDSGPLANHDLFIVHLDGEVAAEPDVACACPCPPAQDTADALRARILDWLGAPDGIPKVLLAVPCQETEAWLVPIFRAGQAVSASSGTASVECAPKPSRHFRAGKPKLVRADGRKVTARYRAEVGTIATNWSRALVLSQAARFDGEIRAAVCSVCS